MTVARFGVPREKKTVASLKILTRKRETGGIPSQVSLTLVTKFELATYLQDIPQLSNDVPVISAQFVFPQPIGTILRHQVQRLLMLERKVQHLECRIPSRRHVSREQALAQFEGFQDRFPRWQQQGAGIDDLEGELAQLLSGEQSCPASFR